MLILLQLISPDSLRYFQDLLSNYYWLLETHPLLGSDLWVPVIFFRDIDDYIWYPSYERDLIVVNSKCFESDILWVFTCILCSVFVWKGLLSLFSVLSMIGLLSLFVVLCSMYVCLSWRCKKFLWFIEYQGMYFFDWKKR